ncbi:hypothetical protein KRP22_005706 [Phytophthora ramorum]|uniref:uncharacterized protein n=1 Tax=Phytophthora ramorum TaxID=164328 RepID=UPI0030AC75AA|nr:hypothetical protein KRP23_3601 [Phytophthora ramorum]KAH7508071.1 hypothetical protein KRP22_3162 [Phytophthora ramorum]
MLLERQDDVVGESCPSKFDSECPAAMMATPITRLPRVLDKGAIADFRGSSSGAGTGARSWLQRSHIQRDEAESSRRTSSDWKCKNSQRLRAQPSASAMVLARKRKRDEQRKLLNGKKQCTESDSSDYNAADSERESLDMEDQLTAFVEYNATDMDSLDINPSQDFDGDAGHDIANQASQCMQTCGWEDVTDVNQFEEEASEVFDNVIYTPRPASVPVASTSTNRRPQGVSDFESAHSRFRPTPTAIPEKTAEIGHASDDSEGSLSDGFNVAANLASKNKPTARPPILNSIRSPKPESKPNWRQRRSVKRDCSFLDNSSYSVNGRLLLMASPTPVVSTSTPSEISSDRIIELKDGCFDSSDGVQKVSSAPSSMPATVTISSPSFTSSAGPSSLPVDFQPRLARKRRKVDQLTLDGFFRKS